MRKLLVYILILVATGAFAQYIPIEEQKAELIWNIQKYLVWENDQSLDRIVLGTYQCPKPMLDALIKTKPSKFRTGIDYYVINYNSIDEIRERCINCQMFYIPSIHNDKVREIMSILDPYSTLVITDEWYDRQRLMINIFVESSGQKVNFEYNLQNMMNHGISIFNQKKFDKDLGGIDLNAKALLERTSEKLKQVRQELQQREQELQQKLKEVELQKKKIEEQNKYIKEQEQIIAQRQAEIAQQKEKLQKLYAELMKYQSQLQQQIKALKQKEQEIEYSKRQLIQYRQKIQEQQKKYYEQAKLLEKQRERMKQIEKEVEAKQKQLKKLNWQLNVQRLVIFVFFVLLVIIGILLYFIFKSYRIQRQQNILLQQQKAQIEEQARELEKLSIVASETSNAVAILRIDGTFEWINAGFTKLYGYSMQMLNNLFDGRIEEFNPLLKSALHHCISKKTSINYESSIKTRDGRIIWVQSTLTPILDNGKVSKIILIDTDITRIKEAEEEIRRKNEQIMRQAQELERKNFELAKLSIVAEHTDNGVLIADRTGVIEWMNAGFERMLGMSFEEFKQYFGDNIIFTDLEPEVLEQIERSLRNKESAEFTVKITTPKGKLLWLRSTLTPMYDEEGNLLKIFSINADITEIKLAQEKIERQNRDITKSIQYARRIQQAALPHPDMLNSILPEHFIIYLPRDIVSGDFYWVSKIKDKLLFAAADCTGHGVPGAFMSMLGIAFLNEIVAKLSYEDLKPNVVLNILREYVIRFLKQEDNPRATKDGMDMVLCMLDTRTDELHFAGANNPLWIVRDGKLMEIKGDDMPIGIYYHVKESFTEHVIKIESGDMLYMFTDGYADQFGGPKGKKFMIRRFRKLILEIASLPLDVQKEILLQRHYEWKGNLKQLDDILVMGVKL